MSWSLGRSWKIGGNSRKSPGNLGLAARHQVNKITSLRELVTSTTVILAPGACGKGVRKRSQVPISRESAESGGEFWEARFCAPHRVQITFSRKGPPICYDFQGETQGEAQGSPRRPKEGQGAPKGAKKSPRGAQGEPEGAPNGAKTSKWHMTYDIWHMTYDILHITYYVLRITYYVLRTTYYQLHIRY